MEIQFVFFLAVAGYFVYRRWKKKQLNMGWGSAPRVRPGVFKGLIPEGVPARGILLAVSSTGMTTLASGMRVHKRRVTVDIEIPGQKPYEADVRVLIPLNLVRDVLPGATVELRVDPKRPDRVAVVGPGTGFAPPVVVQRQAPARSA